jgi:hypothetical protein
MTSTFNGTSSAARSGSRSSRPSAHRHSVERLLPSRVLSGSFECRATFRQHREACRVSFRSRRFDLINRRPRRSERAAVGYPTQADGRRGRVPSNRSPLETLKPVRITRSHATGMQDPVKDPSSSSSVPEPSREPRLPDSDVASCGDPAPGTGGRQGPRERRRGLPWRQSPSIEENSDPTMRGRRGPRAGVTRWPRRGQVGRGRAARGAGEGSAGQQPSHARAHGAESRDTAAGANATQE